MSDQPPPPDPRFTPDDPDPTASWPPSRGWTPPGRLGRFRLLARLGEGGMGVVFRAEDPQLLRDVAVKVMKPGAAGPRGPDWFVREARAQARVEHDHVVPIYHADEQDGLPYLVMPVLRGQTLHRRLKAGRVPPAEAVRVAREAAAGLAALHAAGLVHRDVKPRNIWVEPSGRVRLMDFGLARPAAGDTTRTAAPVGTPAGTPDYVAPEQARGDPPDTRADVYALGCVLYELLTGRPPFPGGDPGARPAPPDVRAANPAVPPPLAALVGRLLDPDPAGRPASAGEVVTALDGLAPARRPGRRAWLAAGAAALLVAATAGFYWATRPPEAPPDPPAPSPAGLRPLDPAWVAGVRGMRPVDQQRAVEQELFDRNPGYDGALGWHAWWENGPVKVLIFTDRVVDLSPVWGVSGLGSLHCYGPNGNKRGRLASLEPLRGLPLREAGFSNNPVRDLSPLAGMPLHTLYLSDIDAVDFEPVYGLRGLEVLHLSSKAAAARIDANRLIGMPLRNVWLKPDQVTDFHRLREVRTLKTINNQPAADFWAMFGGR